MILNNTDGISCSVTSSTIDRKTRTEIFLDKQNILRVKNNQFSEEYPNVVIILKALGCVSD